MGLGQTRGSSGQKRLEGRLFIGDMDYCVSRNDRKWQVGSERTGTTSVIVFSSLFPVLIVLHRSTNCNSRYRTAQGAICELCPYLPPCGFLATRMSTGLLKNILGPCQELAV